MNKAFLHILILFCFIGMQMQAQDPGRSISKLEKIEQKANETFLQREYNKAWALYDSAYILLTQSCNNSQDVHCIEKKHRLLKKQVISYLLMNEPRKAIALNWKLIEESRKTNKDKHLSQAYSLQGLLLHAIKDFDSAIIYQNKCLRILRKDSINHKSAIFQAYLGLGKFQHSKTNYDLALRSYQLAEQNLSNASEKALLLESEALARYRKADYRGAIEYFRKSLDIYKQDNKLESSHRALSYLVIAYVYIVRGESNLAMDYLKSAESMWQDSKINLLELHKGYVYFLMSIVHNKQGDIETANINRGIAAKMFGEFVKKYQPYMYFFYAKGLYSIFGEDDEEFSLQMRAMDIYNEFFQVDNPYTNDHYISTAKVKIKNKEYRRALEYLRHALQDTNLNLQRKSIVTSTINYYMGEIYFLNNEPQNSLHCLQQALISNIVDYFDSVQVYELPQVKGHLSTQRLLHTIYKKAVVFESMVGHATDSAMHTEKVPKELLEHAYAHYEFCDTLIIKLRKMQTNNADKISLSKTSNQVYKSAIQNCHQLIKYSNSKAEDDKLLRKAFYYSQQNKASILRGAIDATKAVKFSGIPDSLIDKEHSLKVDLNYYEQKLLQEQELQKKEYYANKLREVNISYTNLINHFRNDYPRYHNLYYSNKISTIADIQKKIKQHEVVVDYQLVDSMVYAFTITSDNFQLAYTKLEQNLDSLIGEYRASIYAYNNPDDFSTYGLGTFANHGFQLYTYLLKPIESIIKEKTSLKVIAVGNLSLLPYEALLTDTSGYAVKKLADLDYLIKKHDVSYNYSIDLWLQAQDKENQYKNEMLCIAPVFEQEIMELDNYQPTVSNAYHKDTDCGTQSIANLAYLPGTKEAVKKVSQLAQSKGLKTKVHLHSTANEQIFKQESNNMKTVLVATHGEANLETPELSGLYFANSSSQLGKDNDGFLYAHEVFNLQLNTDLLVLYACETGTGKIFEGEGVMALTRGFIYAGSKNIMHTLWSVADASTKDLVVDFFGSAFQGEEYPKSLQEAKLRMIAYNIVPYHWSGVVLCGE